MSVFSHSRIDTFETCPKKYEYAYVLKAPKGPSGIEAFMGSRAHEALEWLYDQVRVCRLPDEEDVVRRYVEAWDAEWSDDVRVTRAGRTVDDYRAMGEKPKAEVDVSKHALNAGDRLLLCSDGLSGKLPDERIRAILMDEASSPQDACDRLVAAANQAGGEDNITVIVVELVQI